MYFGDLITVPGKAGEAGYSVDLPVQGSIPVLNVQDAPEFIKVNSTGINVPALPSTTAPVAPQKNYSIGYILGGLGLLYLFRKKK